MTPLAYVVACASDYGAVVSDVTQAQACLTLEVGNVDQKKTVFTLSVSEIGSLLSIRERVPEHIPSFCPERHINSDGTFCLGWSESGHDPISSSEDAHRWWSTILQFLRLQIRSERLKRWPGQEWAHGDAALHQHRAEELCKSLGPNFTDILHKKALKVRLVKTRDGRKLIRFEMNGQHLYSVWLAQGRVAGDKRLFLSRGGFGASYFDGDLVNIVLNDRIRQLNYEAGPKGSDIVAEFFGLGNPRGNALTLAAASEQFE